jgi:CheY-like chemotaxis protein
MHASGEASPSQFYAHFKIYHELMARKVREILLVASPYDAFILEEDGSLASRIINEYSGLNLSHPPRVTRTASAEEAVGLLAHRAFDLVLTMPFLDDMDACTMGRRIKDRRPDLPVILLAHSLRSLQPLPEDRQGIDKIFIWTGNSDLLLAIVKSVEDRLNVETDTRKAQVRVLILVEDSPVYYSSFLPLIYKEVVRQTQAVLGSGLNEEHRLLKMRARPKILHAATFEEAQALYERYRDNVLGVLSDTKLPLGGRLDPEAGLHLLGRMRAEMFDLPLLLISCEPGNQPAAEGIPAAFLDKNAPNLLGEIRKFFLSHLGFGDFVFRRPDGVEIDRASNLAELEQKVAQVPAESLRFHAERNHFSNWLMARSEISLGSTFRSVQASAFDHPEELRDYIRSSLRRLRIMRQKGVVAQFDAAQFDAEVMDFVKIGKGSLGGKARGLAFVAALLQQNSAIHERFPEIVIRLPQTLVIATDAFEAFVERNHLGDLGQEGLGDREIAARVVEAELPPELVRDLEAFLDQVRHPLSVRSSSLLEDAQFQPYAGLYDTCMIPNNHTDPGVRLAQVLRAVKLVYASTFYEGPRTFARTTAAQPQQEVMAVIVQELAGETYGDYFYPAISGVAQSQNFYPVDGMRPEEGIAHIALGIGKTVVEGERTLRFAPRYPEVLPQFGGVQGMLENAQRTFYALPTDPGAQGPAFGAMTNLVRRRVEDAEDEAPVRMLASTFIAEENRIRDSGYLVGPKVLTFASVLKYDLFPLPGLLRELLDLCRRGMGYPIEIEFAVSLRQDRRRRHEFFFLQLRPMASGEHHLDVRIAREDDAAAFCRSGQVLGNGVSESIRDIVYVKPEAFQASATAQMAGEIGALNQVLSAAGRPYLLVGPGRWGSADPWLGVPVKWHHISGVGAIVELRNAQLNVEPSQGSHFFQNITSIGIPYITVNQSGDDRFDWEALADCAVVQETEYIRHVRRERPLKLKIDGKRGRGVIIGA